MAWTSVKDLWIMFRVLDMDFFSFRVIFKYTYEIFGYPYNKYATITLAYIESCC